MDVGDMLEIEVEDNDGVGVINDGLDASPTI